MILPPYWYGQPSKTQNRASSESLASVDPWPWPWSRVQSRDGWLQGSLATTFYVRSTAGFGPAGGSPLSPLDYLK